MICSLDGASSPCCNGIFGILSMASSSLSSNCFFLSVRTFIEEKHFLHTQPGAGECVVPNTAATSTPKSFCFSFSESSCPQVMRTSLQISLQRTLLLLGVVACPQARQKLLARASAVDVIAIVNQLGLRSMQLAKSRVTRARILIAIPRSAHNKRVYILVNDVTYDDDVMRIPRGQADATLFTRPFLPFWVGGAGAREYTHHSSVVTIIKLLI